MVLPDRRVALVFRLIAVVLALWGILRNAGVFDGQFYPKTFLYFTILSNLLALVWFALQAIRTGRDIGRVGAHGSSSLSPRFGAAVMFALTVTMLIYLVVLIPMAGPDYVPFTLTDNLVHIVTPTLTILDWLLFTSKGHQRWTDPLRWVLIPYAYLFLAYVYSGLGGTFSDGERVPYPFMDLDEWGLGGVALWVLGLTAALVAVAYVYVALDRALWSVVRRRRAPVQAS